MKIALAQINSSMGAIEANGKKIVRFLSESKEKGATLTVFPELAIIGYPPKDLLERQGFVSKGRQMLDRIAKEHPSQEFVIGFADEGTRSGKGLFNAAAYVKDGKVHSIQHKQLLPAYDVFDEVRYFDSSEESQVVKVQGRKMGMTICEDIWDDHVILGRNLYNRDPIAALAKKGVNLLVNLSASPYCEGKEKIREKVAARAAKKAKAPMVYVNLVGGNDELLFDGGSLALNAKGEVCCRAKAFEEDLVIYDVAAEAGPARTWPSNIDAWRSSALIMGTRDYVRKCGFSKVIIGLSGGIDSSLVALLAVEALGHKNVMGVSMPSRYTSDASQEDAESMARKLNVEFHTIPIESMTKAFEESLADIFSGRPRDVEENIQARVRGNLLMAISNKMGAMVLSTGNKSELAVGYCTQYGDMAGGLAVISDLPKQDVYQLARFLNRKHLAVPDRVFERPPSAELAPDQKDQDSLPPYSILDSVLEMFIEEHQNIESIIEKGFDRHVVERVAQMVDRNEFKRRQAPPGLRLSGKAFGIGRRMPIARGPV